MLRLIPLTTCVKAYYPSHPFAVKLHIAIYSWLAIYIDDDEDGNEDLAGFQTRFYNGEPQPSALLARFAEVLQDMSKHFEPLVANFIVLSTLQFVNATLLERRGEFLGLQHCKEASGWPDYIRDRSGVPEAYAYFIFPKVQCPDIGAYMQGIPDMMTYINYVNDVLSYVLARPWQPTALPSNLARSLTHYPPSQVPQGDPSRRDGQLHQHPGRLRAARAFCNARNRRC